MGGKGLLVTNDISQDRVKALTKNVALCGIRNALVTNETPQKLSERFQNRFNRILVDAPCSGEGMFRKDEAAAKSWGTFSAAKCAGMQWDILENMDPMLKENGTLVYSTCTFTPEEDEKMISRFLNRYPHYSLVDIDKCGGIENGRPQWSDGNSALTRTARLWPHRLKGEGHFVALLYKGTEGNQTAHSVSEEETWAVMQEYNQKALGKESYEAFQSFIRISLHTQIPGYFQRINDSLYSLPVPCPDLRGVKVAKFGWYLGDFQRDRFEPSHAMMLALNREDLKITLDLPPDSQDVLRYLKGETLMLDSEKGWVGITVNGYTLGWAKQTGDMLKNHYPKGWRKMS